MKPIRILQLDNKIIFFRLLSLLFVISFLILSSWYYCNYVGDYIGLIGVICFSLFTIIFLLYFIESFSHSITFNEKTIVSSNFFTKKDIYNVYRTIDSREVSNYEALIIKKTNYMSKRYKYKFILFLLDKNKDDQNYLEFYIPIRKKQLIVDYIKSSFNDIKIIDN